jgi:putative cardiolipin synthase
MVFDRQIAWIGSFNLDPRSVRLNTEIVAVIRSERLAGELAGAILDDFSPERSWHVRLAETPGLDRDAKRRMVWTGDVGGRPVTLRRDPAGIWRSIEAFLLSLVPGINDQL